MVEHCIPTVTCKYTTPLLQVITVQPTMVGELLVHVSMEPTLIFILKTHYSNIIQTTAGLLLMNLQQVQVVEELFQ